MTDPEYIHILSFRSLDMYETENGKKNQIHSYLE